MIRPDPAKIIVPRKHGEILIEPPMDRLARALTSPADSGRGVTTSEPLASLRREARRQFLHAAGEWARVNGAEPPPAEAADAAWVITGHQLEFYHPGVWAKVLAADELARRGGAIAFDLLVDHDIVERFGFDVPVEKGDGGWGRAWQGLMPAPQNHPPVERIDAPSLETFERWDAALAEYPAAQTDALAFFLSNLRHSIADAAAKHQPLSYTAWLSRARAAYETTMGIRVHHVPATWACRGPVWNHFVRLWIDNAQTWVNAYNRHLASYRQAHDISSPQHPMPDLMARPAASGDILELPFWVYQPGQARQRLMVRRHGSTAAILLENQELPAESVLQHSTIVIRPRALTLTMFVRLFLADLFIHGIGGALYDQVTDGLLQELFHVVPPYACISAAWLLPLGRPIPELDDLPTLKWRRHHLFHNPQLAIDPFTAMHTDVAELIAQRNVLVVQIANSLRHDRRSHQAERHAWFDQLHAVNGQLHGKAPRILRRLDEEIELARRAADLDKVIHWREWFFGLHTTDSLLRMHHRISSNPVPAAL